MSLSYKFDGNSIIFNYNGVEYNSLITRQIFKEIHDDLENMINCSVHDEVVRYVNDELYLVSFKIEYTYDFVSKPFLIKDEEDVVRKLVDELIHDIKRITLVDLCKKVKLPQDLLIRLASLEEKELILTHHTIGRYLRNEYRLWNYEVVDAHGSIMHPDEVSSFIIRHIWNTL